MSKRGRPSSDNHDDLPAKVTARFSAEEKSRLQSMCASEGVTLSAFVRARVFGRRLASKSDSSMINELRRQGGLLKHLCHEGYLTPDQINPVLSNVMAAIQAVITGSETERFRGELKQLAQLVFNMNKDGRADSTNSLRVLKLLAATLDRFNSEK